MKKCIPVKGQQSRRRQGGLILIAAMLMVASVMAIGLTLAQRTLNTGHSTRADYQEERVFQVSDGGADVAQSWLLHELSLHPNITQTQLDALAAPTVNGYNFEQLTVTKQPLIANVLITEGPNRGLRKNIQPYEIVSRAATGHSSASEEVRVIITEESINLFQFGIYYNEDLELFPTFPLDYMGRVHTNGNLYCGSRGTVDINAIVTVAGHIYNTPKDPTIMLNGKARFMDLDTTWHDLSYDSRDANWVTKALDDWDGNVQDSAMGVQPLPAPIPTVAPTHDLIERPMNTDPPEMLERKYCYRAGLRIIDGVATDSLGNPVNIPNLVLTHGNAYDYREGHEMQFTDFDFALMLANGVFPANGVIYFSDHTGNAAMRVKNGTALPNGGLVFATDNPVYIWGNFNNTSKQPCAIFCDAFNIYSVWWLDANATKNINQRIAGPTWVNTCVIAGNDTTSVGNYNGGAENLIRLHEKWVGHHLTFRGSLVCIWASEQATGPFRNASYVEAVRDWRFDPDLLDPNFWPDQFAVKHATRTRWTMN